MEVLLERRMMAGSKTSKESLILSVVDLLCITGNSSMLVYRSNLFVCLWNVTNCIVINLNGTG